MFGQPHLVSEKWVCKCEIKYSVQVCNNTLILTGSGRCAAQANVQLSLCSCLYFRVNLTTGSTKVGIAEPWIRSDFV